MRIIGKLLKYLLLSVILLALTSSLWLKIVPQKYLSPFAGKSPLVDKLVCDFSTKVSGESIIPIIAPGTSVDLTRCFKENDLTQNTLVLYFDNSNLRFGIIRHILTLNPVVYKVSDEKAPELLHDIIKEEIAGITHNVDVSKTKYQAKKETESFILSSDDFLSDFYLAKIPKGMGLETATVEKTSTFNSQQDKFCFVILPKKNLIGVDGEIVNSETQSTITLGKDMVFNTNLKPNINCMDFGSGQGMLNLEKGNNRYRLLMNHQVLKDIPFTLN